ncbi:MAG: winged helix-turn-helix transcriptional regulator [Candidatus Omnitrophica bacterium]|nr:winged helix-turn-helix transcriptional regulator [Candidatus Omnitrophota bacterium]
MRIKKARQMLQSFADDTRLRIINLLNSRELNVSELCQVLESNQSNVSKHLARLRFTGIVGDKRCGLNIYYYLSRPEERAHEELLNSITVGLAGLKTFKQDLQKLKELRKMGTNFGKGGSKK